MHEAETPLAFSLFSTRVSDYMDLDVLKFTGLSLKEFLSYPRHLLEEILELCRLKQKNTYESDKKLLDEMQSARK